MASLKVGGKRERSKVLTWLAPRLPQPMKGEALRKALAAALAVRDSPEGTRMLAKLAHWLVESGYPEEALKSALAIGTEDAKVDVLAELAPQLARSGFAEKALEASSLIERGSVLARSLMEMAPYLPEPLSTFPIEPLHKKQAN